MRISDWSSDVCSSDLDAAHRIARITRRIGAIDDVELRDVAGADDPPGGGIAERVAEEIRHHEAVDHDEAARRLGRVRAAKSRHRVVIPDETRADEEIGRVFDQILRSEEHTSELQSLMRNSYAVSCLKKKTNRTIAH